MSHRRAAVVAVWAAVVAAVPVLPTPVWAAPRASHVVSARVFANTAQFSTSDTRPGWTRIRNTSDGPLLVLRGTGQGAADLAADYNHKRFALLGRRFPDATTVDPHSDAYARLTHGFYFVVDGYHRGTWRAGQIDELTVSGAWLDAPLPARSNSITFDQHSDVHAASTLSRAHYARLVNYSSRAVDIEAIKIDSRTSKVAVERFVAHPSLKKLTTLSAHPVANLAQAAAPSATIYNPEYLQKGREMLISFTSFTGKLHRGQAKLVTVR